ncbi:alpha/beta fold hydrolase [Microvirga sp. GCM10011540]|uniref:alpha/beta fold hydrolase n=1 Tax=Microvirga sp. GCM10011540 TaxID=3317338 RepID=UPI00361626E7
MTFGFGDSEKPNLPPSSGYTSEVHADNLASLVEHLGLAPVVVVAHDIGATIAQTLARRFPHHVRALALLNPSILASVGAALSPRPSASSGITISISCLSLRNWSATAARRLVRTCATSIVTGLGSGTCCQMRNSPSWSMPTRARAPSRPVWCTTGPGPQPRIQKLHGSRRHSKHHDGASTNVRHRA